VSRKSAGWRQAENQPFSASLSETPDLLGAPALPHLSPDLNTSGTRLVAVAVFNARNRVIGYRCPTLSLASFSWAHDNVNDKKSI